MKNNWKIGDKIQNRWEIHKILGGPGKSGMGIVFVVYDHDWNEVFAAKTFQEEAFRRNPQIAERFKQEALAWVNLDAHENVVQARMVRIIEGWPLLFLEYVSGGDLKQWIGSPRLTEDMGHVLRLAVQFCDGMQHVLAKGIVAHRDIKPANCLLIEDRTLKVTDFGLSKVFEGAELPEGSGAVAGQEFSSRLSVTGAAAGTPPYMAPEQFIDAKNVDVRADIYSFGVMLFEMVTGRLPFSGRTWEEWLRQHHEQAPPGVGPFSASEAAVGQELQDLIQSCLAKTPRDRPQGFGVLRERLGRLCFQLTGHEVSPPVQGKELGATQLATKGLCLAELGRREEALAATEAAIQINPQDERIWFNKGIMLTNLGRESEALAAYEAAIRFNPRYGEAWCNKGIVLAALGRMEAALAAHDMALQINPRDERAWDNKGIVLAALGRKEEALAAHDTALQTNHQNAIAWLNKGILLSDLGRNEEALAAYDQALQINPRFAQAWFNKEVVLNDLGRKEEALAAHEAALAAYETALRINPRDKTAWFNKGLLLAKSRLFRESLACFEEAVCLGHPRADQLVARCRQILSAAVPKGDKSGVSERGHPLA